MGLPILHGKDTCYANISLRQLPLLRMRPAINFGQSVNFECSTQDLVRHRCRALPPVFYM